MYPYLVRISITLINFLLQTTVYTTLSNIESSEYYRLIAILSLTISLSTAGIQNYIAVNYSKVNKRHGLVRHFIETNLISFFVISIFFLKGQIPLFFAFLVILNAISYYFASIINAKGNSSLYLFLVNGFNSSIAMITLLIFQVSGQMIFLAYILGGLCSLFSAVFILKKEINSILIAPIINLLKDPRDKFKNLLFSTSKARINHYVIAISNGWFMFGFLSIFSYFHIDISQIAISLKYSTILFFISNIEQLKALPKLAKISSQPKSIFNLLKKNFQIILFINLFILFSISSFFFLNILPLNIKEVLSSNLFINTAITFLLISITIPFVTYDMHKGREGIFAFLMVCFITIDLINITNPSRDISFHYGIHLLLFLCSYTLPVFYNRLKYKNI